MALVYFDSSALVKLVIGEAGTELAVELWDGCDAALASRLAYPEVRAALAALVAQSRPGQTTARRGGRRLGGVLGGSPSGRTDLGGRTTCRGPSQPVRPSRRGRRSPCERPGYRRPGPCCGGLGPATARGSTGSGHSRGPGRSRRPGRRLAPAPNAMITKLRGCHGGHKSSPLPWSRAATGRLAAGKYITSRGPRSCRPASISACQWRRSSGPHADPGSSANPCRSVPGAVPWHVTEREQRQSWAVLADDAG